MFHVGHVVRQLRKNKKWKQGDLAVKAGVGTMTISAIENDATNWERDTLTAIARALGVDLVELFVLVREGRRRKQPRPLTDDEVSLLALWARVPAVKQPAFRELMHGTTSEAADAVTPPPRSADAAHTPDAPPSRRAGTPRRRRA